MYCRRGYAEAEIEAVFAKYDIDGDRALDDAELRQMTNDLENQKVSTFIIINSSVIIITILEVLLQAVTIITSSIRRCHVIQC